jgi:hypothetical protein
LMIHYLPPFNLVTVLFCRVVFIAFSASDDLD